MDNKNKETQDCIWRFVPQDNRSLSLCAIEFLDSTGGRDKFFRVIQFYAKFILPFIKGNKQLTGVSTFIESFGAVSGITRKMLNIGRYIACLRNALNRINTIKSFEWSPLLKTLSDFSLSAFFLLDNLILVNKIGAYKFSSLVMEKIELWCNLAWGIDCLVTIICDVLDYYNNIGELKALNLCLKKIEMKDSEEYKSLMVKKAKLKVDQFKKIVDLSRCIADFPVIIHFLTSDNVIPGYIAGLLGVVSSLLGGWQKWVK